MYSSKQTTHSTCRPVYLRRHSVEPTCGLVDFSSFCTSESGTAPAIVWDRERIDRGVLDRVSLPRRGEVDEAAPGLDERGEVEEEVVLEIVW